MPCRMGAMFTVGAGPPGILTRPMKLLFGNFIFIQQNTVARNKCFENCGGIKVIKKVTLIPRMCQFSGLIHL